MDNDDQEIRIKEMSPKETRMMLIYWMWIIGSFIAMIICAVIKPAIWLAAPICGQLMAGLAIIFAVKEKKRKAGKLLFYLLFLVCGVAMVVLPILTKFFGITLPQETILWLALAVGLAVILNPVVKYIYSCRKYTEKVDAVCTDLLFTNGSHGMVMETPVYQFTYNGKTYEVHNNNYRNYGNPGKGDHVTLLIDPNDPEEFFDKKRGASGILGGLFIGGIFLVIAILGLIIVYFHPWG